MRGRRLKGNDRAAILAVIAGVLFLLVGWTGARSVGHFFALLVEIFGPRPLLLAVALVFVSIASLGGIAVFIGGWLFHRDRVRPGKILILLGTGAGLVSFILYSILLILRPGQILAQEGVVPVMVGIILTVAARAKARPVAQR